MDCNRDVSSHQLSLIINADDVGQLSVTYEHMHALSTDILFKQLRAAFMHIPTQMNLNTIIALPGLYLRVLNKNLIFLFLQQNICCGYLKELSH